VGGGLSLWRGRRAARERVSDRGPSTRVDAAVDGRAILTPRARSGEAVAVVAAYLAGVSARRRKGAAAAATRR
jgi:hypothetical protein